MKFARLCGLLAIVLTFGCRGAADPASTGAPDSAPPAVTKPETPEAKVIRLEKELAAARTDRDIARIESRKAKCRWLMGILGLLAAASASAAYFVPLYRGRLALFALILGGLIPVVLFVSRFAAYWEYAGAAILLGAVGYALYLWHRDHYTLSQVVGAVEDVKEFDLSAWKGIKDRFASRLDPSKAFIDAVKAQVKG